jgi:MFS family permease
MLVAGSGVASKLVDRFTAKPVLVTGLSITVAGFIVLTQVSGHGDYWSHVFPAMLVLGIGLGLSFVPITISATTGVAAEDSGLASGLLNTTQQVGGALGLAILSTVSTTRLNHALHGGAPLPVALTHGFKGGFIVAAVMCAAGAVLAMVLLPGRKESVSARPAEAEADQLAVRREAVVQQAGTMALSAQCCPGSPALGHVARLVAAGGEGREPAGTGR